MAGIRKTSLYRFYRFVVFFLFIFSMYPWITWRLNSRIVWAIALIFSSLLFFMERDKLKKRNDSVFVTICLFALILWIQKSTLMALLFGVGLCWCIYVFLMLRIEYKKDIINFITKWFAVILGVSLVYFVLYNLGIPLPHNTILFAEVSNYSNFNNYFLFIQPDSLTHIFRFQSVFLEPGHMVMGLAPLLFVNQYNLKNRYVVIMLVALLSSFSLAAYAVTAVGFIWEVVLRGNYKSLAVSGLMLIIFVAFIARFYEGDLFDELIFQRLHFEDGDISGNDRMNLYFAGVFASFVQSSDFLLGVGSFDQDEMFYGHGSSGWQVFTYIYGLVGLLMGIIAYLSPAFTHRKKWSVWGLSIICLLILAVNGYPTWWCMLIIITFGSELLSESTEAKDNKKQMIIRIK